jgi:hypothetical protein
LVCQRAAAVYDEIMILAISLKLCPPICRFSFSQAKHPAPLPARSGRFRDVIHSGLLPAAERDGLKNLVPS